MVLEWDDVLCRPVFKSKTPGSTKSKLSKTAADVDIDIDVETDAALPRSQESTPVKADIKSLFGLSSSPEDSASPTDPDSYDSHSTSIQRRRKQKRRITSIKKKKKATNGDKKSAAFDDTPKVKDNVSFVLDNFAFDDDKPVDNNKKSRIFTDLDDDITSPLKIRSTPTKPTKQTKTTPPPPPTPPPTTTNATSSPIDEDGDRSETDVDEDAAYNDIDFNDLSEDDEGAIVNEIKETQEQQKEVEESFVKEFFAGGDNEDEAGDVEGDDDIGVEVTSSSDEEDEEEEEEGNMAPTVGAPPPFFPLFSSITPLTTPGKRSLAPHSTASSTLTSIETASKKKKTFGKRKSYGARRTYDSGASFGFASGFNSKNLELNEDKDDGEVIIKKEADTPKTANAKSSQEEMTKSAKKSSPKYRRITMDGSETPPAVSIGEDDSSSDEPPPPPPLKPLNRVSTTKKRKRSYSSNKRARSTTATAANNESLESVRDYFSNLDKSEKLTLANNTVPLSPEVHGAACVRTMRGVDLTSPGLAEDYQDYKDALSPTVRPMGINDYARVRTTKRSLRLGMDSSILDLTS